MAGPIVRAFVVGASRVVLGVHWFSDVVGGWTLGAGWLAVVVTTSPWVADRWRTVPGKRSNQRSPRNCALAP